MSVSAADGTSAPAAPPPQPAWRRFGPMVLALSLATVLVLLIPLRWAGWAVGPALSWTFPDQLAIRARIRAAGARADADLAAFDGAVLGALREVEQALATEAADRGRRDALRTARDRDARAVSVAAERFRAGAIGSLDDFDAQRTLIADEAALAQAEQQLASDQILLFKALGGGWRSDTPANEAP